MNFGDDVIDDVHVEIILWGNVIVNKSMLLTVILNYTVSQLVQIRKLNYS